MGRKQGLSYSINQPDLIEHVAHRTTSLQQQPNNQIVSNNQDDTENDDKRMVTPDGGEGGVDSGVVTDGGSTSSSNSSHQGRQSPTHIPHMTAGHTQHSTPTHQPTQNNHEEEKTDPPIEDTLPPGWEKHEDNDGPYYWHIKSGTITRTPPEPSDALTSAPLRAERRNKDPDQTSGSVAGTVTRSNTSSALSELSDSPRSDITEGSGGRPIRFAVRSLGWVEIAEEDLTPERSSKAVNRCIVDLSVGRRDVLDVVGCWGDGKDLFMDLDEGSLKLVDPENLTVLNTQPIHTIRVWGVGRDNGRDFAYVARDRVSRKHMCHVFRCDTPARTIANTLRDICKKIMIERSLQQNMNKSLDSNSSGGGSASRLTRPTNLPTEHRRLHRHSQIIPPQSFPTPMEEPKKVMRVQYVGVLQVERPSGMDVLNSAIDRVVESNPRPWRNVSVAVAPSTVTITNTDDGKQIAECRVRFLSFLGIGQDVKHCAFIMHTAQDQFIAYVFHCEPSTGALSEIPEVFGRAPRCKSWTRSRYSPKHFSHFALCVRIHHRTKGSDFWVQPAEREVIPHRHLTSPGGGTPSPTMSGCPFSSRQVQALVSPTCESPHSYSLHRSPTTPALMMQSPPTPATPMSPMDALRRLQLPPDLSPSREEEIDLEDGGVDLEEGIPQEADLDDDEEDDSLDKLGGTLRNE
ncbi:Fe65-like [Homarus americanus]|uniref:Fe65-like n=1 Tax=Homarus americanus TaxID=6706 RepID=A0A8J5K111_HOMAM|nr:Fe65-like [Homarus americanus]